MDYNDLAKTILDNIGSEQNVSSLGHCATRLRFNLKDDKVANTDKLKHTPGIMGVVSKGGQYQIIIGSDVSSVYKEIINEVPSLGSDEDQDDNKDDRSALAKVIDTITGIFTPILPAITAAGMLKAVLSLLVVFNVVNDESQTYQVVDFMADAAFYFLPILLAASSAQKFKTNAYLAMMVGGILLHPNFVAMVQGLEGTEGISVFGLPVTPVTYSSSVIPIILAVWFMSYIEPIADRISPKAIKFFSKPLITIAIVGTASIVIIGPLGHFISDGISAGITTLENVSPWLVPTLLGALSPLFVATGTHYGLVPIGINNRMVSGYDTVIYPGMLASNVGQGAAALAVGFKSKDSTIKQLASSAGLTGIFGITEPALYGVNLRFKTPLYAAMIGGGIGGLFMGIFRVRNFAGGAPGLLTLPSYIGDDTLSYFTFATIGAIISIIIAFIVSYILYKDPTPEEDGLVDDTEEVNADIGDVTLEPTSNRISEEVILAPIKGEVVSLAAVEDGMFSEEILGKGVAIKPAEGVVVSPISGTVSAIFDSKHAIGLTTDAGLELLIHVGIDTVQLEGEGYQYFIEKGQRVQTGDQLLTFDLESISSKGFPTITPIVITNSTDYGDIISLNESQVETGTEIIKVIR
ncbi:beta-glucoside-specific PTS transporter subunit IIABC [Amphibacillus cookii]|uniref:beta-glucoside-specific PTS transporter subunit IIABC n=1 Tax=Amphibacillus cookii TaxID=767787 RepID=UPI00195C8775|nr:beta-glucoside-specific PTS transporter subunit IIABC [Amphibacillus cookii]MBM7541031.1 PTS system beta-glucosides-specific IIC component [Amphibacillus cookii]